MVVCGDMFYCIGVFLGVVCSYDDGPVFACLEWQWNYLLCSVFAHFARCFVHDGVFVGCECGCCSNDFGFRGCVVCALGEKWGLPVEEGETKLHFVCVYPLVFFLCCIWGKVLEIFVCECLVFNLGAGLRIVLFDIPWLLLCCPGMWWEVDGELSGLGTGRFCL